MTNLPSPAALVTAGIAALTGALGLLALQIVLGLEYTDGGTLGTRASMIGAMVTLALLPVFLALAWRYGARLIACAIGVSFGAFLFYSLPATSGRTGEIKEAKASIADTVASWQSEHTENAKQLKWAVPDKNAECAGAPDPLPPNGWPNCRRKMGTVTALQERQAKLEADIKAAGTAGVTGDLGSTLWAWALSWAGVTAGAIRKGSVLAFAVGLDFAIWSLVAFAEHVFSLAARTIRANRINRAQSSFGASAAEIAAMKAFLGADKDPAKTPDIPGPSGGWKVGKAQRTPDRPKPSAPANIPDKTPDGRTDNRPDDDRKGRVLAFIQTEAALGRSIPRQADLVERFGVPRSTVSDWMGEWERSGLIPARRTVGRCKAIVPELT